VQHHTRVTDHVQGHGPIEYVQRERREHRLGTLGVADPLQRGLHQVRQVPWDLFRSHFSSRALAQPTKDLHRFGCVRRVPVPAPQKLGHALRYVLRGDLAEERLAHPVGNDAHGIAALGADDGKVLAGVVALVEVRRASVSQGQNDLPASGCRHPPRIKLDVRSARLRDEVGGRLGLSVHSDCRSKMPERG
jgi:hypothetical protein